MAKKRIFIFLSMVFLLGCGVGSDLELPLSQEESPDSIVVLGGKEGINVIVSEDKRRVRYTGEILNQGVVPSCFIDISFSTKGIGGNPIDQGFARADVDGFTLTNFGNELLHCLKTETGRQVGKFDTGEINLTEEFADFDFRICLQRNGVCQAFSAAQGPRIPLVVVDLNPGEINGMRTFTVRISNAATDLSAIAYDVTIHFTVLNNQGKVIGRAASDLVVYQPCPDNIQAENLLGCIHPGGVTNPITVNTGAPVSDICEGCFHYRIYYSE